MMSDNISIYILCADKDAGEKEQIAFLELGLPKPCVCSGDDFFSSINGVIADCQTEYALICHDDVVLPATIVEQVNNCIGKADAEFGPNGWAFMGNAGIDAINYRSMRFVKDSHEGPFPWKNTHPYPAVHLDGNLLLVQVRNCRVHGFIMPPELKGMYGYDLVLVMESYLRGLACGIDSTLFAIHENRGDAAVFDAAMGENALLDYLKKRFINHSIITLQGLIKIENTIDYIVRIGTDKRKCFYSNCVQPVLSSIYSNKKRKKVFLVTLTDGRRCEKLRRLLDSIRIAAASVHAIDIAVQLVLDKGEQANRKKLDMIVAEYNDLPLQVVENSITCDKGSELISAFKTVVLEHNGEDESYYWFINENDFVMPSIFPHLPQVLHDDMVTAGDVQVFDEIWYEEGRSVPSRVYRRQRLESRAYCARLIGEQGKSRSGLIYPASIIRDLLYDEKKADCQCDDDFSMMSAFRVSVDTVPLVVAGMCISLDPVDDDGRYTKQEIQRHATTISRCMNAGVMGKIEYDYLNYLHDDMEKARQSMPYRFMQTIMEKKWVYSFYDFVKPLILPVLQRFLKIKDFR